MLSFERFERTGTSRVDFTPSALIIAGWTGRDPGAVQHHIRELAALGVHPPSTVPLFYRASAQLVTQAARIEVVGKETSGEAEAVLIAMEDGLWVGIGSDHTDRAAEAYSVALSKQLCPKPIGPALWRFDEIVDHWDALRLSAHATRSGNRLLYQKGGVSGLRPPSELIERFGGDLAPGTVMFAGTVPARSGIHPADGFEIELHDPVLGRTLSHRYETLALPVVS
ncbi:MAG TPA: DUF2848 domain-containing protein [Aliidongia sp.]|nr:DUF2848 domain-containing protein [Aliidongia sp.]